MIIWRLVLVVVLFFGGLTPQYAGAQSRESTASALYDKGLKAMRRGYYTKALEHFNRVRNYHRDDPVSMLAELAIADLYYKQSDYEAARFAYEDFARLHPRHKDLDYVNYQIGNCHYERAPTWAGRDQLATEQAVKVWAGYSARHPDSAYLSVVDEKLTISRDRLAEKELKVAQFYARRGGWMAVQKRTERVLLAYPDSQHTAAALALLSEAYHRYGEPDRALIIRNTLKTSFPDTNRLVALDRVLSLPPGAPAEDKIFVRPHSYPSATPGM